VFFFFLFCWRGAGRAGAGALACPWPYPCGLPRGRVLPRPAGGGGPNERLDGGLMNWWVWGRLWWGIWADVAERVGESIYLG
jgi:hypothetical protein